MQVLPIPLSTWIPYLYESTCSLTSRVYSWIAKLFSDQAKSGHVVILSMVACER